MKYRLKQVRYALRLFVPFDTQETVETAAASSWNVINRKKLWQGNYKKCYLILKNVKALCKPKVRGDRY